MNFRRFLIYRADRIGDVVLTLPVIGAIRSTFPDAEVTFYVRSYTRELVEGYPGIAGVILSDRDAGPRTFHEVLQEVKQGRFDVAVHVYPRPAQAWLSFRAGIPVRIGTAFRWYSFLYNERVRDHRKTAEHHEAIYNIRLLRSLGVKVPEKVRPYLPVSDVQQRQADEIALRLGIRSADRVAVVHPGSGGSARDWSPERFGSLASMLRSKGFLPVITGGAHERTLVERVVEHSAGSAISAAGHFSLMGLAAFLKRSAVFVSNSTGPMHIACAVGTPVVGLFPPLTAAGVKRWGPLGERATTLTPDRDLCPLCKGGECRSNVCMDQITVEQVLLAAVQLAF